MQVTKRGFVLIVGVLLAGRFCDSVGALPQPPDNAALLYYQAYMYRSKAIGEPEDFVSVVYHGHDPSDRVRQFVSADVCREAIELATAAAETPHCDWGLRVSGKWRVGLFATGLRSVGSLLSAEARVQAADGQYLAALETALRLRRFARHVGDDAYVMWDTAQVLDAMAFSAIQYVLGVMPADGDTLRWLKSQLAQTEGAPWRPSEALTKWGDMEIQRWQVSPEVYAPWKDFYLEKMTDEAAIQELRDLTQSALLERMRVAYDAFKESAIQILSSDSGYGTKNKEISQFIEQTHAAGKKGAAIAFMAPCVGSLGPYYRIRVNAEAEMNAVKAAVDVYLIQAETGHLPESLPKGIADDPYSGTDFDYRITEGGFSLRCQAEAINYSAGARQFDFKVHKVK
jgi:hypothetical protein